MCPLAPRVRHVELSVALVQPHFQTDTLVLAVEFGQQILTVKPRGAAVTHGAGHGRNHVLGVAASVLREFVCQAPA